MVVIVVLSILTALSVVGYRGMQERAYDASVKSTINEVAKALQNYNTKYGLPPLYYEITLEDRDAIPASGTGDYNEYAGGTLGRALYKKNLLPRHFQNHLKNPRTSNATIKSQPLVQVQRCVDFDPVLDPNQTEVGEDGMERQLFGATTPRYLFRKDVIVVYAQTHRGVSYSKLLQETRPCLYPSYRDGEKLLYQLQHRGRVSWGGANPETISKNPKANYSYAIVNIKDYKNAVYGD